MCAGHRKPWAWTKASFLLILPLKGSVPHPLSQGKGLCRQGSLASTGNTLTSELSLGTWEQEQNPADGLKRNDFLNAFYSSTKEILPACTTSFPKKSKSSQMGLLGKC